VRLRAQEARPRRPPASAGGGVLRLLAGGRTCAPGRPEDGGTSAGAAVGRSRWGDGYTETGRTSTGTASRCPNGSGPVAALVQAADGDLYGTTYDGGANGAGTVFKITPSGELTTLYSFCSLSACADGEAPVTGLVLASDGNFYGTTTNGGVNLGGTVFRITASGTFTTIYDFCAGDCLAPGTPNWLIQAADGNLYGTAAGGGYRGAGTVFKMTLSGTLTTLHLFCSQSGCADGYVPNGIVQAANGDFYGTTYLGGGGNNYGTIYKITSNGTLTTLVDFHGGDGARPASHRLSAGEHAGGILQWIGNSLRRLDWK